MIYVVSSQREPETHYRYMEYLNPSNQRISRVPSRYYQTAEDQYQRTYYKPTPSPYQRVSNFNSQKYGSVKRVAAPSVRNKKIPEQKYYNEGKYVQPLPHKTEQLPQSRRILTSNAKNSRPKRVRFAIKYPDWYEKHEFDHVA